MSNNRRRGAFAEAIAAAGENQVVAATAPDTEAPTPAKRTFTHNRMTGIAEAARMTKKPTIRLKPSECSVWPGNARDYETLNEDRLRSLIESIQSEGGNRIPAVVRRTPDGEKPYELITGTRRHWAISWLNANHYPDIDLIATIEDIDDEAAFRLADIENREREDISDLERARNYKEAIDRYYNGVQSRMAERLKISNSKLSRYVSLASFPATLISAFASPADVSLAHAEKLAPLLRHPTTKAKIDEAAAEISAQQSLRQSENQPALNGPEVVRLLIAATAEKRGRREKPEIVAGGMPIGKIIRDDKRNGLTITILPTAGSDVDAILAGLRPTLESARFLTTKTR